jgi:hypothetical protein
MARRKSSRIPTRGEILNMTQDRDNLQNLP